MAKVGPRPPVPPSQDPGGEGKKGSEISGELKANISTTQAAVGGAKKTPLTGDALKMSGHAQQAAPGYAKRRTGLLARCAFAGHSIALRTSLSMTDRVACSAVLAAIDHSASQVSKGAAGDRAGDADTAARRMMLSWHPYL